MAHDTSSQYMMRGIFLSHPILMLVTFQTLSKTVSILGICVLQGSSPISCSKVNDLVTQGPLGGATPKAVSLKLKVPLHDICSLPILACHSLRHRLGPGSGMLMIISGVIEGVEQNADQMLTLLIILTEGLRPDDHPGSSPEPSVASSSQRLQLVGGFTVPQQGLCLTLKSPSLIRSL